MTPARRIASEAEARRALGVLVRIEGVARRAKAAPMVEAGDLGVYLLDLPAWPADRVDRAVVVEGVLEATDDLQATVDAAGAISQGTSGGDLVLRASTIL